MNIHEMTALEIRRGITEKQFSATDVVTAFFERIHEKEPLVDGFLTLCRKEALAEARRIDGKIKAGEPVGKLAGVPVAIKDNICTGGIRTTCASRMLQDFIPPYDATVVKKLKEADAVIIGKTNMDEFAMGSSTENSAFKKTRNPWDRERVPGGSSGGSAAVVSAGMAALALGSDTGGSVRQPAAFCGVVGLKPTYGLVSRFGLIAFGSSLDQVGPMANNIKDSALALEAIQGEDKKDSTSVRRSVAGDYMSTIEKGVKGMRIGIPAEFFHLGLDEEIAFSIKACMQKFKEMGTVVEDISLPVAEEGLSAYYIISSAEASSNLGRFDGLRYGYRTENFNGIDQLMEKSRSEGFGEEVKRRIMLGTFVLSSGYYDAYYNRAQKLRARIREQFVKAFESYDILLSPTSPVLPFKIGEKAGDPLEMYLSDIYTVNINLAGLPALSMPCGISHAGLPIGLQIIGPHFGEDKIFRAAYALEQELKLTAMRPKL
ncbi:MAG TPA: Asp-tRNA(Asn)/Glu-tRNA(Gln) amidotransferase subunit GatA [Bacillota bacterium]|nr:Asp-tRNA(Asn)/Glu-tRNA(Gln) amidotransferase subunit GatA [Bacillota bacterium]